MVSILSHLLIILSAIIMGLSFLFSKYLFIFPFIGLVPLFYIILKRELYSKIIFLWPVIVILIQAAPLMVALNTGTRPILQIIAVCILALYISIYGIFWLYVTSYFCIDRTITQKTCFLILSTWLYFLFTEYAVFWFFGVLQGCSLINILLPLTTQPLLTSFILFLGGNLALLYVIMQNIIGALYFVTRNKIFIIFWIIAFAPWILSAYFTSVTNKPIWLSKISAASIPFDKFYNCDSQEISEEILKALKKIIHEKPEVKVIIMPESTFPFSLNLYPLTIYNWSKNALESRELVIGTHRKDLTNNRLYCNLACVNNSVISYSYDKQKLLFFAEAVPPIWNICKKFEKFFLEDSTSLTPGEKPKNNNLRLFNMDFTPVICSELFLGNRPETPNNLVLAIVNDAWYQNSSFPELLVKTAQLKATLWRVDIVYVSHFYSLYISKTGEKFNF